nr:unnamed protein product [Callosobruchus chinensis]
MKAIFLDRVLADWNPMLYKLTSATFPKSGLLMETTLNSTLKLSGRDSYTILVVDIVKKQFRSRLTKSPSIRQLFACLSSAKRTARMSCAKTDIVSLLRTAKFSKQIHEQQLALPFTSRLSVELFISLGQLMLTKNTPRAAARFFMVSDLPEPCAPSINPLKLKLFTMYKRVWAIHLLTCTESNPVHAGSTSITPPAVDVNTKTSTKDTFSIRNSLVFFTLKPFHSYKRKLYDNHITLTEFSFHCLQTLNDFRFLFQEFHCSDGFSAPHCSEGPKSILTVTAFLIIELATAMMLPPDVSQPSNSQTPISSLDWRGSLSEGTNSPGKDSQEAAYYFFRLKRYIQKERKRAKPHYICFG